MICLDTLVLVWGVEGATGSTGDEMVERTRTFFASLRDAAEVLMVPAPAVGEYLQRFDDEHRAHQLAALDRYFFIPAYDPPAAALAAELARRPEVKALFKAAGSGGPDLAVDLQIVATAIVQGAETLLTPDLETFRILAGGRIKVSEVPRIPTQTRLLFDLDG